MTGVDGRLSEADCDWGGATDSAPAADSAAGKEGEIGGGVTTESAALFSGEKTEASFLKGILGPTLSDSGDNGAEKSIVD